MTINSATQNMCNINVHALNTHSEGEQKYNYYTCTQNLVCFDRHGHYIVTC